MACYLSSVQTPTPWFSSLSFLLLALAWYLGYGFFSTILLSVAVIISLLLILAKSKQKQRVAENVMVKMDPGQQQESHDDFSLPLVIPENSSTKAKKEFQEEEGQANEYPLPESDFKGLTSTSEDSEMDSPMQHKAFMSSDCSDGSISDEESLIEIALPSGQYVGKKQQEQVMKNKGDADKVKDPSPYVEREWPEFGMAAFFKQHGLMELLAELTDVNEEENLIEIDLSMGSSKCTTVFEIEA